MGDFVSIAVIVVLVLLGPWFLVWRSSSRRKRERKEDQERRRELTSRTFALERTVRTLQSQRPSRPTPTAEEATPNASESPAAVSHTPPFSSPNIVPPPAQQVVSPHTEPVAEPSPSVRFAESWVTRKTVEPETEGYSSTSDRVAPPASTQVTSLPSPSLFASESAASLADQFKSSLDVEEMLGTNWLNKLGIVILVLGVAFFLAYQLKALGPGGKVLVGFVTAGVMLGAGIWFDRRERYRILARTGIGGGWALLFFTTYAMYHVPASQVLSSQAVDLVLMLVVAMTMVVHTLRYRSQVVTGLAFLLAFLTVAISHSNVYSLSAGAVLAAGLVVIVGRMQWFELEVFGILASYLNHCFCRLSCCYCDRGFASASRQTRWRDGFIFESEEPDCRSHRTFVFRRIPGDLGLHRLNRTGSLAGSTVVVGCPCDGSGKQGHWRRDVPEHRTYSRKPRPHFRHLAPIRNPQHRFQLASALAYRSCGRELAQE